MPFGNEVKDFMTGLTAGMNVYSDYQRAQYTGAVARQQQAETAEYTSPEVQDARRRRARAEADKLATEAEESTYKFKEYSGPGQADLRQREREALVGNQESVSGANRIEYEKKKYEWAKLMSPRGQEMERAAEDAALMGNQADAYKKASDFQKQQDEIFALRREHAALTIQELRDQGKPIPKSLEIAATEQAPTYLQNFSERWNIDPAQTGAEPQTTGALPVAPSGDMAAKEAYIRQSAQARGIDPNVAVRVARSEGLANGVWQSNVVRNGKRETSYGPFQLLVGGGLGDKFVAQTGLDPKDPNTFQAQVDFALDQAKQGGWSPWYGAAKVGVSPWTGIDPNAPAVASSPNHPAPAPQQAVPASSGGLQPMPPRMGEPATTGSVTPPPEPLHQTANEMNKAGMEKLYSERGLLPAGAVPTQDQQAAQRQLLMGDGAADPEGVQMARDLYRTWESDDLSPAQNDLIRGASMYKHMKRYHPEKAQAVAGELLQSALTEAQKYRALSQAAASRGDRDAALKTAVLSLQYVPNGVDPMVRQQEDGDFEISFVRGGQTIHREVAAPEKILASVLASTPADVIGQVYRYAGIKDPRPSDAMSQYLTGNEAQGQYMGAVQPAPRDVGEQPVIPMEGEQPEPNFAGMQADEIGTAMQVEKYRQGKGAPQREHPFSPGDMNQINTDVTASFSTAVGGPAFGALPAADQKLIQDNADWLQQAAGRAVYANPNVSPEAATSNYLRAMQVSETNPFGRPFVPTMGHKDGVDIDMRDGSGSMRIPWDDYLALDQRRYEVEKMYFDQNERAKQQGVAVDAASVETARRGQNMPAALPGEGGITDYESFRDAFIKNAPATIGTTINPNQVPPDIEQMIQAEWQKYQAQAQPGIGAQ